MAQPKPSTGFSDFIKLNSTVLISPQPNEPSTVTVTTSSKPPPDVILITSWLNAQPRHIAKYTTCYTKLYPTARIIVVTTDTVNMLFHSKTANLKRLTPVLEFLYGIPPDARILLHSFSNGGAATLCTIVATYLEKTAKPLPMTALVLDSSPGRATYEASIRAFTVSIPKNILLRFLGMAFFRIVFGFYVFYFWVFGKGTPVDLIRAMLNKTELFDTKTPRLYVYGWKDVMVQWKDVEEHVADARSKGYVVDSERFEDTGHVSHLVAHEEEYIGAVQRLWNSA
ncbi:hypothetical protein B7463_g10471, partial [Scytalidium lignicola]